MDTASTEQVTTARLILRPLRDADAARITQLAGDFEVARWTALIPHPYPPGEAARFVAHAHRDAGARLFAIARRNAGADLIGMVTLRRPGAHGSGEIGYWLGRPHWGNGIMSEAVAAIIGQAARWHPGAVVGARIFPGNRASARVLEKTGLVSRGRANCATPARETPRIDGATLYELALKDHGQAAS